jgi:hypothetical protein
MNAADLRYMRTLLDVPYPDREPWHSLARCLDEIETWEAIAERDHGKLNERINRQRASRSDRIAEVKSLENERTHHLSEISRLDGEIAKARADADANLAAWRQAHRQVAELARLRPVYEAAKTWCETVYIGKPHPRFPAYPGDELLLAVNAVRFAAEAKESH